MTHPPQWLAVGSPSVGPPARPAGATADIVINLCASATPVALARPRAPEFKPFSFFVSRRLEGGRERFRLHMGYFATREQAERMLPTVRQLYPAAWIGEAPGRRLRAVPTGPGASGVAVPAPAKADLPQDAQSGRDMREQISLEAPVHYAVQLLWGVSPIDLNSLAGLSIFDVYSLYRIEGNREGRRWYGLRLGFFSDADAAKQVAGYVRPEFEHASVVPVSAREREQALTVVAVAASDPEGEAPAPRSAALAEEVTLFDDATPPSRRPTESMRVPARVSAAPVDHDHRGGARSIDETLEILGADDLSFDGAGAARSAQSGRSAPRGRLRSRFSGLLDRLSARLRR